MKHHISAPAPRMLLRLIQVCSVLDQLELTGSHQTIFCEVGAGLGDATSLALDLFSIKEAHIYEGSSEARDILQRRFMTESKISIHNHFSCDYEKFDMLMCFEVIEHIEEDQQFLNSINRSIKSGGRLIGSVPAYMDKWQDVDVLAGHFRRYERDELTQKLELAGFYDIQIDTYGFPLINILYPLRKIYYGRLLKKRKNSNKQMATAKSGTSRGLARCFNTTLVWNIVRFFSLFQSLPLLNRLGDGFIFSCRKRGNLNATSDQRKR